MNFIFESSRKSATVRVLTLVAVLFFPPATSGLSPHNTKSNVEIVGSHIDVDENNAGMFSQ